MGYDKDRRPALDPGHRAIMPANVTSTATLLKAPGVYAIPAPSADKTFQLGHPKRGAEVTAFIDTNSTKVVTLQTLSSAETFFGSTNDRLTCSTGVGGLRFTAVGLSTSQWAIGLTRDKGSTAAIGALSASTR